jgi:hypothetical protein
MIEEVTGTHVILSSQEAYEEVKASFLALGSYREKLQYWQKLPFLEERFVKYDERYRDKLSCKEYKQYLHSDQEEQYEISIKPQGMEEQVTYLLWLIELPDRNLEKEYTFIFTYPKERLGKLHNTLNEAFGKDMEDMLFQEAYHAFEQGTLEDLVWEKLPQVEMEYSYKLNLIPFCRKAKYWYKIAALLAERGFTLLLKQEDASLSGNETATARINWINANKTQLAILVKGLIQAGYIRGKEKDIFEAFGAFTGIDLANYPVLLSQGLHNRKNGYSPQILRDITKGFREYAEKQSDEKQERDKEKARLKKLGIS